MAEDDLSDLLRALDDLLRPHLERSEPLRRLLDHAGRWLIEQARKTEEPDQIATTRAPAQVQEDQLAGTSPAQTDRPGAFIDEGRSKSLDHITAEVPLRLGDDERRIRVSGTPEGIERARMMANEDRPGESSVGFEVEPAEPDLDLSLIARRCRLKAQACHVFIKRRRVAGDEFAERPLIDQIDEMIAKAKALPNCFLWMLYREREQPEDSALVDIAHCYDALAESASLLEFIDGRDEPAGTDQVDTAFQLLAEAHSALRIALEDTWLTSPDRDQEDVHTWLRRETTLRRIYVPRYMKLDDPADPSAAAAVREQAADLLRQLGEHESRLKRIEATFRRLRYHVDQLDGDYHQDRHHYRKVAEAVESLIDLGVPPSDRRFRPRLKRVPIASIPDEFMSPAVARVFKALEEWHRGHAAQRPALPDGSEPRRSDRVAEVGRLLSGGVVVMIGGEPRIEHIERIREAFDLADVYWPQLTEHGSGQPMRPPIFRSDTRLVIVLAKLAGHLHMDDAVRYARDAGKPYVVLKAGYSPEQIAEAVLAQASEQLSAAESASL